MFVGVGFAFERYLLVGFEREAIAEDVLGPIEEVGEVEAQIAGLEGLGLQDVDMFVSFEFEHGGGVHRSFQRGTVTVEIDSPEPGDGCKLGGKPPGVGVAADVESGRGYFCHRVVLIVLG